MRDHDRDRQRRALGRARILLTLGTLVASLAGSGCKVAEAVPQGASVAAAPLAAASGGAPPPAADPVERGRYLVTVAGCHDCHTPWILGPEGPEPDMSRALSGHPAELSIAAAPAAGAEPWIWQGTGTNTAFAGPWGVSFTANLTPHASGLGAWTEEIFIATLRTGKHWGQSRPILPPMPWQNYAQMSDPDLQAVFAYLRTLPPIENRVPEPLPPAGAPPQPEVGG